MDLLVSLERKYPNDMELGENVRILVRKLLKIKSNDIQDQQLTGQINIFGEVKK